MTKEVNTLYPTNIKNKTELREFVKNVLLNLDFPSYKDNVKYLLHQSLIPKDITGIISEFVFCNKHQWNDAMEECIKMYSRDLQDLDFFIPSLFNQRGQNEFLYNLEKLRQEREKAFSFFKHKIKDMENDIWYIKNNSNYHYQDIIDKLNMYIYVLKIDTLDMSYRAYYPQEKYSNNELKEFDIKYKINYKKGIDMEMLLVFLNNKVSENCKKISQNFKLNLEDEMTKITWNFNVHTRVEGEKNIDGLLACHTGALFGYFFYNLIETIKIKMLKKIKHDLLDFNLSLPPI